MNQSHLPAMHHSSEDAVLARRRYVLSIVIQEYTRTAQPVASRTIAERYGLGVSAATIRNDLAALEKEGMLTHPHTSAGRVPTDAGYRYFVQHLLSEPELPSEERRSIRMEFGLARQELDQWLRVSASVLARTSHSAALATAPRLARSRYKHLELVGIHGVKVLMVLVLQDGTVEQQLLDLDKPLEQSELSRVSNELNSKLRECDAATAAARAASLDATSAYGLLVRQVALLAAETIQRLDSESGGELYSDGLAQVMELPEFAESASVRKIVRVIEQRSLLDKIAQEYLDKHTIQVVIAGDGRFSELQDISLVIGSYGVSNQAMGMLGVLGPLRMSYGRTIGAVRFVAALMSELVGELYGAEPTSHPALTAGPHSHIARNARNRWNDGE